MLFSKNSRNRGNSRHLARGEVRSLIKKASRGNIYAFNQVANEYFDLISDYLYLSGYTAKLDRIFVIEKLLSDCWKYLPYTRRVSDFERFLEFHLGKQAKRKDASYPGPFGALSALDHRKRFLLAARIFNEWEHKPLRLALRCSQHSLANMLLELKCDLAGMRLDMLRSEERDQLLEISEFLEGRLNTKKSRMAENRIATNYHAQQFKADWLERRCDLAELHLEMEIAPQEKERLTNRISVVLVQEPMEKPSLSDSLINQFTFVRIP